MNGKEDRYDTISKRLETMTEHQVTCAFHYLLGRMYSDIADVNSKKYDYFMDALDTGKKYGKLELT